MCSIITQKRCNIRYIVEWQAFNVQHLVQHICNRVQHSGQNDEFLNQND